MTAEQRRLKRTRLIERVRTVEQRQSALAAAEAEDEGKKGEAGAEVELHNVIAARLCV